MKKKEKNAELNQNWDETTVGSNGGEIRLHKNTNTCVYF